MYFLFYANFSNVSYDGREFLRCFSFIEIWCDNLLTIYNLGDGRGGGDFSRIHPSVDDCTKARKNIRELEVDLHCKKHLLTVKMHI